MDGSATEKKLAVDVHSVHHCSEEASVFFFKKEHRSLTITCSNEEKKETNKRKYTYYI